jgi:hypothetical protein
MTTCAAGNWGSCSIQAASADTCDQGDDSDCNGVANDGCHYIKQPGGTVYDTTTGLTWRLPTSVTYSWTIANADCPSNGSTGWRLPTVTELLSIVDTSMSPTVDGAFFTGMVATEYWTTTFYPGSSTVLLVVSFADGGEHTNTTSVSMNMICVK